MDSGTLSAADVALLNKNSGFGSDSFMWIFGLLILMGLFNGNFGGFGGNAGAQYATREQVQNGFDTQNMQMQTNGILSAVTNGTAQTIAASTQNAANAITAIKDGNASLIREFGNVETALASLAGQQQNCCCDIKQLVQTTSAVTDAAIAAAKYETAMQMAGMEQRLTSKMDASEITNLRDQVNALQLQAATANVMRYPNGWTFNGGYFPPMSGGCNCGNI